LMSAPNLPLDSGRVRTEISNLPVFFRAVRT
jgi:hypothetical protein